ncbi:hypothetical protein RhiirA4_459188 [Rhizophagus irregularis]|uniref:Uncharacterized protein n=1 Tax=Rhizophagus irregularis TaxID=588596 RepID=A0A2I1GDU3_9GLOM|nr:hypothetical protein RhiirA4_459188 [Rhizophagus irregularis]
MSMPKNRIQKKRILRVSSYVERNTHTLLEQFKKNLLRRLHQENTLYIKYTSMMSTTENNTFVVKGKFISQRLLEEQNGNVNARWWIKITGWCSIFRFFVTFFEIFDREQGAYDKSKWGIQSENKYNYLTTNINNN